MTDAAADKDAVPNIVPQETIPPLDNVMRLQVIRVLILMAHGASVVILDKYRCTPPSLHCSVCQVETPIPNVASFKAFSCLLVTNKPQSIFLSSKSSM
jgi:hypothetical protein